MSKTYILQKDIDWFGKKIPAGTRYEQHGKDYWWPVINDAHCPTHQVYFMTVLNNDYFIEENKSNDSLQWTDKLVEKILIVAACNQRDFAMTKATDFIDDFKKNYAPKPQAENKGESSFILGGDRTIKAENKPDWEIVKFELYYNKGSVMSVRDENGKFKTRNGIIADEAYMLLKYPIHSVKRLSDGEVFSVGDVCGDEVGHVFKPIKRFFTYDNVVMYAQFDEGYGSNDGCLGTNSLKKLPPQPQKEEQRDNVLLTTEWSTRSYTQQQVDELCEKAFLAGRKLHRQIPAQWIYKDYQDYKKSKQ